MRRKEKNYFSQFKKIKEFYINLALQTPENILQFCPLYQDVRNRLWPHGPILESKLWGSMQDFQQTVLFMNTTDIFFLRPKPGNAEEEEEYQYVASKQMK
jgi:hypothetical protein